MPRPLATLAVFAGLLAWPVAAFAAAGPTPPRAREFHFRYQAAVTGLKPGEIARVWLPVPPSNADQEVSIVERDLPAAGKLGKEPEYGNRILHFEAAANEQGKVPLALTYRVKRKEVRADPRGKGVQEDVERFLRPDKRVPVGGKCLELIRGRTLPSDRVEAARVLYDVVNVHMRCSKVGVGWGRGDAAWACQSGYGNCSDFHSLFISLARSQKIPATFEIGFPLPSKRGKGEVAGYHCWAKFKPPGAGWVPVDISEANKDPRMRDYYFGNLTEDRVAFSTGRDLTLVPRQDGAPLNFFVYPYVEVGGRPYAEEKVERRFSYRDVGQ